MNIVFFDTETTGNTANDRLCQLAYKSSETVFNNLYKPPIPITVESMAVCHVTNKMVADKPAFIDSLEYLSVKEMFESTETVPVAHNAVFYKTMLQN